MKWDDRANLTFVIRKELEAPNNQRIGVQLHRAH